MFHVCSVYGHHGEELRYTNILNTHNTPPARSTAPYSLYTLRYNVGTRFHLRSILYHILHGAVVRRRRWLRGAVYGVRSTAYYFIHVW